MAPQVNSTTLTHPEDWENWYRDLRSGILPEIWQILDPEGEEKSTLPKPEKPMFTEYHTGATRFSDLSQSERKDFLSAQHIYESQLKEYNQQAQKLLDIRNKIHLSVSDAKKAQLPIEKTTREWVRILTDCTKPSVAMAIRTAGQRYRNSIVPIRNTSANTVIPWIQEWETAMAEDIRANLTQTLNIDIWLGDFCTAIRGIAESFATAYELKLSEGTQGLSFQAVGSAFRSWYSIRHPTSIAGKLTLRGGAFQARFAGEHSTLQEVAEATNQETSKTTQDKSENHRKRHRSSTSATDRQRGKTRCPACDQLHEITQCWLVVEATRPPDWKPSQKRVDEFEKRLKKQKSLAELVKRIRKEHEDQA